VLRRFRPARAGYAPRVRNAHAVAATRIAFAPVSLPQLERPEPGPARIPEPTPDPVPEPVPGPARIPEPGPARIPEPTPDPVPEPVPGPAPSPPPTPVGAGAHVSRATRGA
jgi:outer membrane biosynthesis protein TonB